MNIIIYGASYPDVFKVYGNTLSEARFVGVVDDVKCFDESDFMGFPIVGDSTFLSSLDKNSKVINNVHSSTRARFSVDEIIQRYGFSATSVIHSGVDLSYVALGDGVFVHQNVAFGANVIVGSGVAIRMMSVINHDNNLGDYSFIGPGVTLCGHVNVGRGAYIGAGSVVKERVIIGEGAVVGAGAVVVKDVDPWTVVVGSPAKKLRDIEFFDFGVRY